MTKNQIGAVIFGACAILGAVAFFGFSPFVKTVVNQFASASPNNTTNSTSKISQQIINTTAATSTASSTLFAQLNSDANDRTINAAELFFRGGLNEVSTSTTFTIACATSSNQYNLNGNTNYVYKLTVGAGDGSLYGTTTSNAATYVATTSSGITGTTTPQGGFAPQQGINAFARTWQSGSYLVCTNTTAVGSNDNLLDASTTGYMSFPYRGN